MSTPNSPSPADVIASAIGANMADMFTAMPGRVERYDAATKKADIQPLIKRGYDDETGTRVTELLPVVPSVPVVFPGAGVYAITWPLSKGDIVLLVFMNCSIDLWLTRGGIVDPSDDRRFSLSDAVAIPGLRDFAHAAQDTDSGAMVISAPEILAGGLDAASLATKDDVQALRDWIKTSLLIGISGASQSAPGTTNNPPNPSGTSILKGK